MQVIDMKYLLEKKKVSYYEVIKDSTGIEHEVKLRPESPLITYDAYEVTDIAYIDEVAAKITIKKSQNNG